MYAVVGSDGVVYGPIPLATLYEWIAQGRVASHTTLIDWQGRQIAASMAPELRGAFPPPAVVSGYPQMMPGHGMMLGKSRRTALWLAFLLGMFGAHRFYLGHTGSAIAMLVLNLATLFFVTRIELMVGLGLIATVWLIVDMAMLASGALREANGQPLR